MIDIVSVIASELKLQNWQIENSLALKAESATIPFIARYRKERTGQLDENQLRDIFDRFEYLTELEDRKNTVIDSIESQGKMTDELRNKINATLQKNELEDLYLPFKPKKRTKATIAREKGLEPLATLIKLHNMAHSPKFDLDSAATPFLSETLGVASEKEALQGAADIIAEEIAEQAEFRKWVREYLIKNGIFHSKFKEDIEEGSTKYERYRDFEMPVNSISPHVMLALRRGEAEDVIMLELKFDEQTVLDYIASKSVFTKQENMVSYYNTLIKDGFTRLMKHSLIGEVRLLKKQEADAASIQVFEQNLRQMLLAAPAGMKPTIGLDPGFRTGCKMAALDETGRFLEYKAIFPHNSKNERKAAADKLIEFVNKYNASLIAIGNGTASRETDEFVKEAMSESDKKPLKVIVSEAGASVYSASKVANEEFPELDVTVRGAISIARRLQDPLAELVKIDPKSIGVGQYQHDVDQKLLKNKLEETVESCVNFVGVNLNTASKELLTYASGITPKLAESIINHRNTKGAFRNRKQLMDVPKFGAKAFEQSAGFLRIPNGDNPLDNTAVHPESYHIVEKMANENSIELTAIAKHFDKLKKLDLNKYITDTIGLPTLRDILSELEKPGRDPREEFKYATFQDGINEIKDLRTGMILEGVVTNITNFGAFVDIGVHQDGLVHISEIANKFITNPTTVLKVGQVVQVKVLEVNENLRRINLSIKQAINN